ncbi:MAG: QueT transporter family protein [Eubacteriales bacterium]
MKSNATKNRIRIIVYGALIAALYVVLTYIAGLLGLANGVIQVRFSEALTILPTLLPAALAPAAVGGLFVGCILANTLTGCLLWDIVFGSLATLLGAVGTFLLRRRPYLAWIPPVIANILIVPPVLQYVYGAEDAWWFLCLTVGAGEIISCGLLGMLFYHLLHKRMDKIL